MFMLNQAHSKQTNRKASNSPIARQLVLALNDDHHVKLHTPFNVHVLVVVRAVCLGAELPVLHLGAAVEGKVCVCYKVSAWDACES